MHTPRRDLRPAAGRPLVVAAPRTDIPRPASPGSSLGEKRIQRRFTFSMDALLSQESSGVQEQVWLWESHSLLLSDMMKRGASLCLGFTD